MRFFALMLGGLWFAMPLSMLQAADAVKLPNCLLSLDEEVQVPAQEPGVLMKIPVRDGQQVAKGDLLAQIDDIVPRAQYNVARYKLKVAEKQAVDDIEVRFAVAGADVYAAKLRRSLLANNKTPGTVSDSDIDEQRLERDKFVLQIEKAKKDMEVAGLQKQVSEAELEQAGANLERRRIVAPLDAVVIELSRHEGEWVQPGDPVMRLMRIDQLRVEGFVDAKKYSPSEIEGRPVEVVVNLARGRSETFPGKIVFVKRLIQTGGEFLVRAEVQNRKQGDFWVLSPGLPAEMTIQLK
jgi:multidrug efflux pump subunit AcrA (membrane-fusion protein)